MKPMPFLLLATSVALTACGAPAVVATIPPAPVHPPAIAVSSVTTVLPVRRTEAPREWQLLDEATDFIPGISADRAMKDLLAGMTPKRTVIVAVIDGGIDTAHVDLRANLWTNPKEIAGNGKDDDGNGFIDDVHGWDFIGGRNDQDVHFDTFEITRQYARCHGGAAAGGVPAITDATQCAQIDTGYVKQRKSIESSVQSYREISTVMQQIVPILQTAVAPDTLSADRARALKPDNPRLIQAREIYLELAGQGATPAAIEDGLGTLEGELKYSLDPQFNPRTMVGDDYANASQRDYGNADVMGPDAKHGTHVSGIIGAVRGNGIGIDGVAPAVKLMMVRAVPEGDERDKDVANAIRYAVDNGAQIINMSFGKSYSPFKATVDDAVKYADVHGILMVHAAGNDGENLDSNANYPTAAYLDGGHAKNWIEIGASSWKGGDSLAAPFSNYSATKVDAFAPGVDILSTIPGNAYERNSGTSMASPVVTGLAALLMDYFPSLTATDVRTIIVKSVSKLADQSVLRPQTQSAPGDAAVRVPFGSLSVTGGIVNAYLAVEMAREMTKAGASKDGSVQP